MAKKRGTTMRKFGVGSRESHDSDAFYGRALYDAATSIPIPTRAERKIPKKFLDRILCRDSRSMSLLPDCSVHLMVTSPPYNVGKEYDADLSLREYRSMLLDVFRETYRVLVPGGRICVNVANLGRKPYIPLHRYIIEDLSTIGFLMRGEIIWDKSASAGTSTAWGSWRSASNPILRDVHEYILIFSKETFARTKDLKKNTISRDEFLRNTKSIWNMPAESARRVKHPAPFPVELPARLIQLFTFAGDVVLDPFAGSGSTCLAAKRAGRHFIGFDISGEYVKIATQRLDRE